MASIQSERAVAISAYIVDAWKLLADDLNAPQNLKIHTLKRCGYWVMELRSINYQACLPIYFIFGLCDAYYISSNAAGH
jgi:hypothetical protein